MMRYSYTFIVFGSFFLLILMAACNGQWTDDSNMENMAPVITLENR